MAKVMTANYRHVTQEEGKDYATRIVLHPGDSPDKLPSKLRKELEERGMIKDEEQFDKRTGVVLPAAEALKRYELSRATPTGEAGADDEAQSEDSAKGKQARRVLDPEAAAKESAKGEGEGEGDGEPKQATPPQQQTK